MMKNLKNKFPKPPKSFHNKVVMTLDHLPEQEKKRKMPFKRIIAIAACAALLVGTSVYAGSLIASSESYSTVRPTYTSLPTSGQLKKDIRFAAHITNEFSNGFKFHEAFKIDNIDKDDSGNVVRTYESLKCVYKNNDRKLLLVTEKNYYERTDDEYLVEEYNGVKIYYTNFFTKNVPADYVMTEQDEKDKASGKYMFSFGLDEVQIKEIRSIGFELGEISYHLMDNEATCTQEELLEMAKEIIDKK